MDLPLHPVPLRPFWGQLTAIDQARLVDIGRRVEVAAGEALNDLKDQPLTSVWVLQSGFARIYLRDPVGAQTLVDVAGPGAILGTEEPGMLRAGVDLRIIPISASLFLSVSARDFWDFVDSCPRADVALRRLSARHAMHTYTRHHELLTLEKPALVASVLHGLATSFGHNDATGSVVLPFTLSQNDLASLAGVSRETLVRALRVLRRGGLVETGRSVIRILGLSALADAAGIDPAAELSRLGPTPARRLLGLQMRRMRTAGGMTLENAARRIAVSRTTLSLIENGLYPVDQRIVTDLAELAADRPAPPSREAQILADISTQTKEWWHPFREAVDTDQELFLSLVGVADQILIPCEIFFLTLLRTPEYHCSIISQLDITAERLKIACKLQRALTQLLLADRAPQLSVILSENVLHCFSPDEPTMMRDQLAHLSAMSELPNVSLQILPFSAGLCPGMEVQGVTILKFNHPDLRTILFAERLTGIEANDKPEHVEAWQETWHIQSNIALSPKDSAYFILRHANKSSIKERI